ncbi:MULTISPECIES: MipA/OmpV family protein [Alkalimonas]|uniref:MipA/OmpV family protein n=1 Tax=Alkalimonas mucilaginosa TaxID=3057676 RepID=A0ABU7JGI7_9GAMM|nr:MipA/OmpV family protein [Alkalimonas sp. MEB004]MEE2024250.1 MipA/OmpV family protein [Alkalimonas sp. MEB004]
MRVLQAATLLLASTWAFAGDKDTLDDGYVEQSSWRLSLAVGAGQSSSPLYDAANMPLYLMPDISYYGKVAFFDNGILGAGVDLSPHWSISLVSRLNPEKGYFYRWHVSRIPSMEYTFANMPTVSLDARTAEQQVSVNEVERRPTAWDGGVQLNAWFDDWTLRLNGWTDISGQHHGHELSAVAGRQLGTAWGQWRFSAGLFWKSENLMQRYYGLGPDEATYLPRYQAKASLQPELGLYWSLPLTDGWRMMAFYRYRWLDTAMTRSPLVEQSYQHSWFLGWSYRFF